MAIDLQLNNFHDLDIENGDCLLVEDANEVPQSFKIRVLQMTGEDLLNVTAGVPWVEEWFKQKTQSYRRENIIRNVLATTQGVKNIRRFDYAIDPINRSGLLTFEAQTDFDAIVGGTIDDV